MIANVQELIDTIRAKKTVCSINLNFKTHCLTNIVTYKCIELCLNIGHDKKKGILSMVFQSKCKEVCPYAIMDSS